MDMPIALAISTLLWKAIDFLRLVVHVADEKSAVITQVCAWIGGIITVTLAAHAQLFNGFTINGQPLGSLDGASLVFIGLIISSLGSALVDVKQAIDHNDTAAKPALLNKRPGGTPE